MMFKDRGNSFLFVDIALQLFRESYCKEKKKNKSLSYTKIEIYQGDEVVL